MGGQHSVLKTGCAPSPPLVCVQNDRRAIGSILRCVCWGTPHPRVQPTPPPFQAQAQCPPKARHPPPRTSDTCGSPRVQPNPPPPHPGSDRAPPSTRGVRWGPKRVPGRPRPVLFLSLGPRPPSYNKIKCPPVVSSALSDPSQASYAGGLGGLRGRGKGVGKWARKSPRPSPPPPQPNFLPRPTPGKSDGQCRGVWPNGRDAFSDMETDCEHRHTPPYVPPRPLYKPRPCPSYSTPPPFV